MSRVIVIGSYVQDHCWSAEALPAPGESRIGQFSTGPGGKGFNQAVAANRLGASTRFVGALGRDPLGDTARSFAAGEQLDCAWFETDSPTAASSIVVDAQGRNQICVALGANDALPAGAASAATEGIARGDILVAQLETALTPIQQALDAARAAGALTLLNPAPINPGLNQALIAASDLITPNETEFMFLLRHLLGEQQPLDPITADDQALHQRCRQLSNGTVVITLGGDGAFVSHAEDVLRGDVRNCYRVPAAAVEVIDTTGAGDAFSGALAAALALHPDAPFADLVGFACRAAGLSTERPGTAPSMATPADLRARFGDGGLL
ncbi:MAG: ribokinase [Xanthomonadales bacterium]|nr:ribokinase [Xanthomonadales bacterium]